MNRTSILCVLSAIALATTATAKEKYKPSPIAAGNEYALTVGWQKNLQEYYFVQDTWTHKCFVATEIPRDERKVLFGPLVYASWTDAEVALKQIQLCPSNNSEIPDRPYGASAQAH